jgi:IS4 transposase
MGSRPGDTEIEIVTDLPVEVADAAQIAALYLRRWTGEGMFQELTQNLGCEVDFVSRMN